MKKAYTSRAFETSKRRNWQSTLNREASSSAFMFQTTAKIMIFAGGIPLKLDGKVVGAIGVSGGSGDQDHAVAAAGAAAF